MRDRRVRWILLLVILATAVVLFLAWRYRDNLVAINLEHWIDAIASSGPVPFFAAMTLLPLLWVPISPFLLLAGAFELPVAIGGTILALTANIAISWLLSGKLFRPLFERLVHRFGYKIPRFEPKTMVQAAFLLRITPGMPFPFQNYLLGLAGMPFHLYMLVSVPTSCSIAIAMVIFGDALLQGNLGVALMAVVFLLALTFVIRSVRHRLRHRQEEAEIDEST